jgi:hypothetical protein
VLGQVQAPNTYAMYSTSLMSSMSVTNYTSSGSSENLENSGSLESSESPGISGMSARAGLHSTSWIGVWGRMRRRVWRVVWRRERCGGLRSLVGGALVGYVVVVAVVVADVESVTNETSVADVSKLVVKDVVMTAWRLCGLQTQEKQQYRA